MRAFPYSSHVDFGEIPVIRIVLMVYLMSAANGLLIVAMERILDLVP